VAAQDDPLDILPLARLLLKEVDRGEGVLVMTDVFRCDTR
jgi:PTS system mannose-specific IIA component